MTTEKTQLIDTLNIAIFEALANTHTSTVAKVTGVNDTTINCKPVINRYVDGQSIQLPEFIEVPPVFMQGGNSYTAHPISKDDYCLLIFTERCFDRWYDGQDNVLPAEYRMHDYSDGFAIVGVNPRGGAIQIPSVITQIGDTYQSGDYEHEGNRTQTGNFDLTGDFTQEGNFTLTGNMTVDGNITCTGKITAAEFGGTSGGALVTNVNIETTQDVIADGISLNSHTHGGVQSGGSSTGGPQ